MIRHHADPETPWRAAAALGKLVAQGVMAQTEASASLAAAPAPGAECSGWRARREWRLADAAAAWARARRRTAWNVAESLRPLLAARAPLAALKAAAAAADPREALTRREHAALLARLVAAALARPGRR